MFGWFKRRRNLRARDLDKALAEAFPMELPPVTEEEPESKWIGHPVTIAKGKRRTDAHVRRWQGRKQRLKTIIAKHHARGEDVPKHIRHELIELNMQLGDPLDGVAD